MNPKAIAFLVTGAAAFLTARYVFSRSNPTALVAGLIAGSAAMLLHFIPTPQQESENV